MRLEAESYGDPATAAFIEEHFIPFTVNIHEKAGLFGRFNAAWTPTILIMSPKGLERYRIEGYYPREAFKTQLELGLARVAFMAKHFDEAERWYDRIVNGQTDTATIAEALYWRAVCRYKISGDATSLVEVSQELQRNYPESAWTSKSSVWLPEHAASR